MLERAREHGVRLMEGRVERIDTAGGRVGGVDIRAAGGLQTIGTSRVVLAAGRLYETAARMLGIKLPLFCELHANIAFNDPLGAMPRSAPLTSWTDPLTIAWSEDEREELSSSARQRRLVDELPGGAHGRLEGAGDSTSVLGLWTYDVEP